MDRIDAFTPTPDDVPDPEHLPIPTDEDVAALRRVKRRGPRFDLERETQADGAFVIPGKGL